MGFRGAKNKESVMHPKPAQKSYKKKIQSKIISTENVNVESPLDKVDDSLMSDLMWVYQQLGGKQSLLQMLKDDKRAKTDFLKTLLQHETKKLERTPNGAAGSKGKLFVLKGLHDEDACMEQTKKEFANILDPVSQKEFVAEAENFEYETLEPEYIEMIEEVVEEEREVCQPMKA